MSPINTLPVSTYTNNNRLSFYTRVKSIIWQKLTTKIVRVAATLSVVREKLRASDIQVICGFLAHAASLDWPIIIAPARQEIRHEFVIVARSQRSWPKSRPNQPWHSVRTTPRQNTSPPVTANDVKRNAQPYYPMACRLMIDIIRSLSPITLIAFAFIRFCR